MQQTCMKVTLQNSEQQKGNMQRTCMKVTLQNSDSLKKALVSLAAVTSSYFHAGWLHVPFRLFTVPFWLFTTCGLACGTRTVLSVNIDTTRIRSQGVAVL